MKQKEKDQLGLEQREKIIECADAIIDYISEQMIVPRVHEDWNNQLDSDECGEIAEKVYQQIKLRM